MYFKKELKGQTSEGVAVQMAIIDVLCKAGMKSLDGWVLQEILGSSNLTFKNNETGDYKVFRIHISTAD